jgi:hypothetical protein
MRIVLRFRGCLLHLIALLLLLCPGLLQIHAQAISEDQVKAAYLYNFAKFVEWPHHRFASPTSPFEFCVLNDRSFEAQLTQTIKGKMLAGRMVNVLSVTQAEEARSCHILFVSSTQKAQAQIIEALRDTNVLTVGETKHFVEEGGMISFVLEDNRVQFQVNRKAANQVGLRISSRLLIVAKRVIE